MFFFKIVGGYTFQKGNPADTNQNTAIFRMPQEKGLKYVLHI